MSSRAVLTAAMAAALVLMTGCGQQPAKVEKPAEPAFAAEVKSVDSMLVASIAKTGSYTGFGKTMGELMAWVGTSKAKVNGEPFGVFFDNPGQVDSTKTRYEACVPVEKGAKPDKKAGVVVKMAPAMQVAVTEYTGPYDKVAPAYAKLFQWMGKNNWQPAVPNVMIEWYHNDPAKVPAESLKSTIGVAAAPVAPADSAAPRQTTPPTPGR